MDTVQEHIQEDSVTLTPGEEGRMQRQTDALTADAATSAAALVGNDPALVGSWASWVPWPVVAINAALLPNGKVLAYDSSIPADNPDRNTPNGDDTFTRATIWDPATGNFTEVNSTTGVNLFCSGLAHLMDGRIFAAGGNKSVGFIGINSTNVFDPDTNTWTKTANMQYERWYPSVTPQPNGEMLITEGHDPAAPEAGHIPEVREVGGNIRQLTDAPMHQDIYPWMDVAPNGLTYLTGPGQNILSLDPTGLGHWNSLGTRDSEYRSYGSHALYDIGKVLVAGGGGDQSQGIPSSKTAKKINLNGATPQVSATDSMEFGRRQLNLTVLADGSVIATGGNSSGAPLADIDAGVYNAELWNPGTGQWKTLAAEAKTRQYHSTALLLPDGRLLSAGGGICGTCDALHYLNRNGQVFSPPYLFKDDGSGALATRPVVSHAPKVVGYNAPMSISSPDAASIRKVALIRLGAVTHSVNMEQRYVPLSYTTSGGKLTATSPQNANIAPPGFYMLFAIDSNGVPSMAKMVRVDLTASAPPSAPSISATAPASPANANNPKVMGLAAPQSTVSIYSTADCTGTPLATDTAANFNSPGITVSVGDNTITHLHAAATDSGDNISDCSTAFDYTEDSAAPGAPTFTTTPPSPANQNSPKLKGTAESGSTVTIYSGANCNGSALTSGSATTFASPGLTVTVSDDSTTDFRATATDMAGNVSNCSSAVRYVEDSTAPATPAIGVSPASPANQNNPTLSGAAESGSTVKVYSGANCNGAPLLTDTAAKFASSGLTSTVGDNSVTDFRATATDAADNVSNCSSAVRYTEDSQAPAVPSLGITPSSPANSNNPKVNGTAESGSTVKIYSGANCNGSALVTGPAAAFALPGFPVSVGDDSITEFRSTATDAAGNVSGCSEAVRYVEDSTSPALPAITDTDPNSPANDSAPEVKGTAETGSAVKIYSTAGCTGSPLAAGTAAQFDSPGITVTVGSDTTIDLRATATDSAGNVSLCSDAMTYVEDSTAPDTAAEVDVEGTTATATFSSEVGATFACNLDGAGFGPCHSPATYAHLAEGEHALAVRAIDPSGNADPSPAEVTFTVGRDLGRPVDKTAPKTRINKTPEPRGTKRRAAFRLGSSEPRSTFKCRLDGEDEACGYRLTVNVGLGRHRLTAAAIDQAGNVDQSPARYSWRVKRSSRRSRAGEGLIAAAAAVRFPF